MQKIAGTPSVIKQDVYKRQIPLISTTKSPWNVDSTGFFHLICACFEIEPAVSSSSHERANPSRLWPSACCFLYRRIQPHFSSFGIMAP